MCHIVSTVCMRRHPYTHTQSPLSRLIESLCRLYVSHRVLQFNYVIRSHTKDVASYAQCNPFHREFSVHSPFPLVDRVCVWVCLCAMQLLLSWTAMSEIRCHFRCMQWPTIQWPMRISCHKIMFNRTKEFNTTDTKPGLSENSIEVNRNGAKCNSFALYFHARWPNVSTNGLDLIFKL